MVSGGVACTRRALYHGMALFPHGLGVVWHVVNCCDTPWFERPGTAPRTAIPTGHTAPTPRYPPLRIGLCLGMAYLIFYLTVLDPMGLHFYIVFTPRTALCVVSYTMVLCVYWCVWRWWPFVYMFP